MRCVITLNKWNVNFFVAFKLTFYNHGILYQYCRLYKICYIHLPYFP